MAAFSSAGQLRRRPAPVNTSMRRARSRIGVSSEIDMCRSSQSAPNFTPHAWLRKALPRRRLQSYGYENKKIFFARRALMQNRRQLLERSSRCLAVATFRPLLEI